eukprot:4081891-Alexandrium_andersonii.AAC.1
MFGRPCPRAAKKAAPSAAAEPRGERLLPSGAVSSTASNVALAGAISPNALVPLALSSPRPPLHTSA